MAFNLKSEILNISPFNGRFKIKNEQQNNLVIDSIAKSYFGVSFGLNFSKISNIINEDLGTGNPPRLNFSIAYIKYFKDKYFYNLELMHTNLGSTNTIEINANEFYKIRINHNYIRLSPLLGFHKNISKFKLYGVLGPYFAVLRSGNYESYTLFNSEWIEKTYNYSDLTNLNRFEFGIQSGIGISADLYNFGKIGLENRYSIGMTDVTKDSNVPNRNLNYAIFLNYSYPINKKNEKR
jgi:hypothetical protein